MRARWLLVPAVLLGVGAAVLWSVPADEFIFTPDRAKPLADKVRVEGAKPAGTGGVYYVDVFVRRATYLEQLLPFTRPDGSTVVPEHALAPPGTTDRERQRQNAFDMQQSEVIASAVALRALGYDVRITPRGARVASVTPGSPADGKLRPDDVVVAVDERPVRTLTELRDEISQRSPGESVRLKVRRDGKELDLTVGTAPAPDEPGRPVVGIIVSQDADIQLPVDVDIDLGRVGGPSAGLPFALEIARMLGRNVTHGCEVAATGELAIDGTVLPVGGVKQKTIGARRTGVDLFVVPAGRNAAQARENADGLPVIPVKSYQQALRALATRTENC
jgi:PDZ domain-containing protein